MNKNKITIYDKNLNEKEVDVISLFKLESSNKNCIIYKDDKDYYVASYKEENLNNIKLNYDFTGQEKAEIEKLFNKIVGE